MPGSEAVAMMIPENDLTFYFDPLGESHRLMCHDRTIEESLVFVWLRDGVPGFIRVKTLHPVEFFKRLQPEILFVNHAVLADHESSDSGYVVYGRRSNKSKSAYHDAFDDEVHFTRRYSRA